MKWPFWIRILLLPISWVYGFIMKIRNYLFDQKLLKSMRFDVPCIAVGNLSTGGTGKTPMIEFLVHLLKDKKVAIVSRGYGRVSKGLIVANQESTAALIGDEPMQYLRKFPGVEIVVAEKRVDAAAYFSNNKRYHDVVLLDDAFQHRSVSPSFQILLTTFNDLYCDDFVLPAGNLRESKSGASRANIIIVTKCPLALTLENAISVQKRLKIAPNQKIFFSGVDYGNCYDFFTHQSVSISERKVLLVAAIARPEPLIDHVSQATNQEPKLLLFKDHYHFKKSDINNLLIQFSALNDKNALVLTTEKDATRLLVYRTELLEAKLNIAIIPISIQILLQQESRFKDEIIHCIAMQQSP